MIEKSFLNNIKVLDGGMGQELLSKVLKAKGSLWSVTALIEEKYHHLKLMQLSPASTFAISLTFIFIIL